MFYLNIIKHNKNKHYFINYWARIHRYSGDQKRQNKIKVGCELISKAEYVE